MESLDKSFFSSALVVVVVEVEEEEEEEVEGSDCGGAVLEPDCQGDRRRRHAINLFHQSVLWILQCVIYDLH